MTPRLDTMTIPILVKAAPPPPFVCIEGKKACMGVDRMICRNNQWVLYEKNSRICGYEPPPPPPPPPPPEHIDVGGVTVELKCDTMGYCVPEVPSGIEEGILLFPQSVRDFLKETHGQFYVWIWPENWWPKHWLGGDDTYHDRAKSQAYREGYCEMSSHDAHSVLHEIGHCLDYAVDDISQKDEWGVIQAQYWPDPGHATHRKEQWARTVRYMLDGDTGFHHSGRTWCEMYPASCLFANAVMQDPWSYV